MSDLKAMRERAKFYRDADKPMYIEPEHYLLLLDCVGALVTIKDLSLDNDVTSYQMRSDSLELADKALAALDKEEAS